LLDVHANSPDSPENVGFTDQLMSDRARSPILRSRSRSDYFVPHIWDGDGVYE
jgi:hypothetical protein